MSHECLTFMLCKFHRVNTLLTRAAMSQNSPPQVALWRPLQTMYKKSSRAMAIWDSALAIADPLQRTGNHKLSHVEESTVSSKPLCPVKKVHLLNPHI